MTPEWRFDTAYAVLVQTTQHFTKVTQQTLREAILLDGAALAPLRMIVGFTHSELAVAAGLLNSAVKVTAGALKGIERKEAPALNAGRANRRTAVIDAAVAAVLAVMDGQILTVPTASEAAFHSKLDKSDTADGWKSVAAHATKGVPYWELLYQRYVGGVWRQVQDAYSEIKGDALLEMPLALMLHAEQIPFYRASTGASGATATAQQFGISPGPDFLLPDTNPTVIIESKIGEDGGTVRDKAARIKSLAHAATARNLVTCAVVDGKGWSERASALADVIIATGGRTYTLATLDHLLSVPQIAALRGTATLSSS